MWLVDVEAIMMALGVFCVVAGVSMAAGSLWSPRYRAILEVMGGSLFLAGLGLAGADLALAS
ncbi:hypothetical protein [Methylobacterium sp. PvR107]|uniref:hypothetical protein n=1 Tax=Methylobacterium sp. PvR107 TaxID=2806597 RepID=UPI001AE9E021|nr:hypothetical protein [Methylobacterium sp. PvR107]MBP1180657.1 hypothetical protein [Methylobacterium sp. PvR107]